MDETVRVENIISDLYAYLAGKVSSDYETEQVKIRPDKKIIYFLSMA